MGALKYTIGSVKTCNLENLLYLVFGNETSLRHFLFFIFKHIIYTLL
jgi:hypothetical protein